MDGHGRPVIVWCLSDGKAGHENQVQGLLAALRERLPVEAHTLPALPRGAAARACLRRRFPPGARLPDPDLILAAGRATHLSLLAARRARGGRAVVLMRPGLPLAWFDLCIIPAHDRPPRRANVLVTRGVLNRVRPGADRDSGQGLILVGGPSAHVAWSSADVVAQLRTVLERTAGMHWTLTTSRRTPPDFTGLLAGLPDERLTIVPFERTGPDWLPARLARAARVWVTQESVSMVYEALGSGAAVGLLEVAYRRRRDRLARGIAELVRDGLVTTFGAWRRGAALRPPPEPFDEAARCADWIVQRWAPAG